MRFVAKGPHLQIAFDGKTLIGREDKSLLRARRIGLWTKPDSMSAFADLSVEASR